MIGSTNDLSSQFALDTQGLGALKRSAREGAPDALKSAATQFEALFINMMMKSMRDATPKEGMFDNEQTKMFTSMLDQQLSQNMAKRGLGLADVLIRQLSAQAGNAEMAPGHDGDLGPPPMAIPAMPVRPTALSATPPGGGAVQVPVQVPVPVQAQGGTRPGKVQAPHVQAFQEKLGAHAHQAEQTTGIPAKFMLAQAALETGWGKREIKNADGSNSFNLFGIKAGPGWTGKVSYAVTTEFVNGVAQTRKEPFRAYDSYADSFRDYAKLITNNPRYEKVLANATDAGGFARGLQQAGYATDPLYAAKLERIIKFNLREAI